MTNKRALVTGAGARLGREMALYLAGRGYDVAVHFAGSNEGAAEVCRAIGKIGRKAVAVQADLLDQAAPGDLVNRARDGLGGSLDLLVNNASIFEYDTLETATPQSWERHIGSNLRAPFFLAQAFAAQAPDVAVDARGENVAQALIVNMLDQRVLKPTPEFLTYSIAKSALWSFTRMAAQALAPKIRVNGIGPGPTLRGVRQSEEHFKKQRKAVLLERAGTPVDVAATLGFLIDATSVTGQLICVDGGQHLAWKTPDVIGVE